MRFLLLLLTIAPAFCHIIDRIEISVGREAITELQLEEEIVTTAFLNREPVRHDLTSRRSAAHRLVEQALIERDMLLAQFPPPSPEDVEKAEQRVRSQFATDAEYRSELAAYHLTEPVISAHLARQISVLQFIEYRFRPELEISESDLRRAYEQELSQWKQQHPHTPMPDLNSIRNALRSRLSEQRTDESLNKWLTQTGSQSRIVYVDATLEPTK